MTSARGSASFRFLSPGRRLKAYCGTLAYEKTSVLIAGSEVAILFIGPGVLGILYYGSLFRGGFSGDEGVATHVAPDPCAVLRKDDCEASVGERIGQPLSRESV